MINGPSRPVALRRATVPVAVNRVEIDRNPICFLRRGRPQSKGREPLRRTILLSRAEAEETGGKKRGKNPLAIRRARLAVGQLEWFGFFQHVTRDDEPLHLRGAFTDLT
jgi:hypothetical protein